MNRLILNKVKEKINILPSTSISKSKNMNSFTTTTTTTNPVTTLTNPSDNPSSTTTTINNTVAATSTTTTTAATTNIAGCANLSHFSSNGRDLYKNKIMLAPMVRIGTLPARLLALRNGADVVYSEELIDFKLSSCVRRENSLLGVVEYIYGNQIVFQTCPEERNSVVLQMGTCDPQRALKTALLVCNDVAGIDVNMGCPMHFSKAGGMGAALLDKPDTIKQILETLVQNVPCPITCKIRILSTVEDTVALAKMIEKTGVAAVGVHGRFVEERPREAAHYDYIKAVADNLTIPVIANGGSLDISTYEEIAEFKKESGCSSVMLARIAQWNPSIFNPTKKNYTSFQNGQEYLKIAVCYGNRFGNTKYNLHQMMHKQVDKSLCTKLQACEDYQDLCKLFDLLDYYENTLQKREEKRNKLKLEKVNGNDVICDVIADKRLKTDVRTLPDFYNPLTWSDNRTVTPKQVLMNYSKERLVEKPDYQSTERKEDRFFHTVVLYDGEKFASEQYLKSKKLSEQSAAMVCLNLLNIPIPAKKEKEK